MNFEEMADIEGYEGLYKISICGKVWSVRRSKLMSPGSGASGRYKMVVLTKDKKPKGFLVHRLVASAFVPNPFNKDCVNHIDGDRFNNHKSNLEWVTQAENMQHAVRTGLHKPEFTTFFKKGHDPKRAYTGKLSEDQVRAMRRRYDAGESYRSIAKDFPIDESNVLRCCKRINYKAII